MDQPHGLCRSPVMDRLFQCIQDETSPARGTQGLITASALHRAAFPLRGDRLGVGFADQAGAGQRPAGNAAAPSKASTRGLIDIVLAPHRMAAPKR